MSCDDKYNKLRVAGCFVGLVGQTFRSFMFNILMFVIGFACCYAYAIGKIHYYATEHDDYHFIQDIEAYRAERAQLDSKIDLSLHDFKLKLYRNMQNCCSTNRCSKKSK